jgi:hypothetical protein
MTKFPCSLCQKTDCFCLKKIKEKIVLLNSINEDSLQFDFEIQRELFISKYYNQNFNGRLEKMNESETESHKKLKKNNGSYLVIFK